MGEVAPGTGGGGGTAALPPPPKDPMSPHSPEPALVRASRLCRGEPRPGLWGASAAAGPGNRPHPPAVPAVHSPEPCAQVKGCPGSRLPAGLP